MFNKNHSVIDLLAKILMQGFAIDAVLKGINRTARK